MNLYLPALIRCKEVALIQVILNFYIKSKRHSTCVYEVWLALQFRKPKLKQIKGEQQNFVIIMILRHYELIFSTFRYAVSMAKQENTILFPSATSYMHHIIVNLISCCELIILF